MQKRFHVLFGIGFIIIVILAGFAVRDVLREKRERDRLMLPEIRTKFQEQRKKALDQIKSDPRLIIPYVELATVEKALGNLDAAILALATAKEKSPTNYLVWGNLAGVYREKGMNTEADEAYAKALEYGPQEINNYLQYADFLRYRYPKRREDLLAVYEKGLKELNGHLDILRARAGYFRDTGDDVSALRDWKTILKAEPNNEAVKDEIRETEARLQGK